MNDHQRCTQIATIMGLTWCLADGVFSRALEAARFRVRTARSRSVRNVHLGRHFLSSLYRLNKKEIDLRVGGAKRGLHERITNRVKDLLVGNGHADDHWGAIDPLCWDFQSLVNGGGREAQDVLLLSVVTFMGLQRKKPRKGEKP